MLTRRRDGSLHAEDSEVGGSDDDEVENVAFDEADAVAVVRLCVCVCVCVWHAGESVSVSCPCFSGVRG